MSNTLVSLPRERTPLFGTAPSVAVAVVGPLLAVALFLLFGFGGGWAWSWLILTAIPVSVIVAYGLGAPRRR